jgi:hypothetical protein
MQPQHPNNRNNPQLEIAMQQLVEAHTGMMRVLTQNMVNRDSKELPPGVYQVLDDHSQIVQMMSQIVTSTNNSLPQNDQGGKTTRVDVEMTLRACKRCGEIGHPSKDCHEECPYYETSHPIGECPMTQVTCFLCEGTNHIPVECKFYSTVQRMNQQAKDRISLGKTLGEGRPKRKMEDEVMGTTHNLTTKCCYSCEEEGHLSRNCSRKRESFPTAVVEYEENEVRDLLALERPKKKKDHSKVMCFKCKELGHYVDKCTGKYNKVNMQDSVKRDIRLVTCYKCKQKGHYTDKCSEKGYSKTLVNRGGLKDAADTR